jgi:hypothetical protein
MEIRPLRTIGWHDFPIESITLATDRVELHVTPFNEPENGFERFRLTLSSFDSLTVNIAGDLPVSTLANLEISTFQVTEHILGRLDGHIGILPGNAGFWTLSFRGANWTLESLGSE